jgi:hypothetical protein
MNLYVRFSAGCLVRSRWGAPGRAVTEPALDTGFVHTQRETVGLRDRRQGIRSEASGNRTGEVSGTPVALHEHAEYETQLKAASPRV